MTIYKIQNIPKFGLFYQHFNEFNEESFENLNEPTGSIKICFIGNAFVGKSTLITSMKTGNFQENYIATIGVNYLPLEFSLPKGKLKVSLWDIAGSHDFKSITSQFYRGSDIACICFSLNQESSFNDIILWYERLIEFAQNNIIIFLIGCKSDLPILIDKKKIKNLFNEYKFEYFETSSKNNENIEELSKRIGLISNIILQTKKKLNFKTIQFSSNEEQIKEIKKDKCC